MAETLKAMAEACEPPKLKREIGEVEKELRECSDDIVRARQIWAKLPKASEADRIWWAKKWSRAMDRRRTLFKLTVVN
jgi:hypothetical protein